MATFMAGGLCSYLIPGISGILIGRTLSGIGSSGSVSGIAFFVVELLPLKRHKIGATFLLTFAVARFLGPM